MSYEILVPDSVRKALRRIPRGRATAIDAKWPSHTTRDRPGV